MLYANQYWHGTKDFATAQHIYTHHVWLVGHNTPQNYVKGVYLTPNWGYAKSHAGTNGVIIKVQVSPQQRLKRLDEERLVIEIPNSTKAKYYRVEGLVPIEIWDTNQRRMY